MRAKDAIPEKRVDVASEVVEEKYRFGQWDYTTSDEVRSIDKGWIHANQSRVPRICEVV